MASRSTRGACRQREEAPRAAGAAVPRAPGDNGSEEVWIKHVTMDGTAFADLDSLLKPPPRLLDAHRPAQLNHGQRQRSKPRDVHVRSPVASSNSLPALPPAILYILPSPLHRAQATLPSHICRSNVEKHLLDAVLAKYSGLDQRGEFCCPACPRRSRNDNVSSKHGGDVPHHCPGHGPRRCLGADSEGTSGERATGSPPAESCPYCSLRR